MTNLLDVNALDQQLARLYPADQPGAAVLIARRGEVLFRKAYGMANLELNVKMEPGMVFRLASITKQFTAMAILMLMEEGKLGLQDRLTRFLPDYPDPAQAITIEHLLTHTSGVRNYTSMPEWFALWRKDLTLNELIDLFKNQSVDFAPGQQFSYNDSGYVLLGAVIEQLSGLTFAEFMEQRIFRPAGMLDSWDDVTLRVLHGRVPGYSRTGEGFANAAYLSMSHAHAAGGAVSSVDDMARWDAALADNQLVRAETLDLAYQSYVLPNGEPTGYGYGWSIHHHAGVKFVGHSGGINGFSTGSVRVPSEGVYVVILSNNEQPAMDTQTLAFRLAALASGCPVIDPPLMSLQPGILNEYTGLYEIRPGEQRQVVCEGGLLYVSRTGSPALELLPFGPDAFFIKDQGIRYVFLREAGNVVAFRVERAFRGPDLARKLDDLSFKEG